MTQPVGPPVTFARRRCRNPPIISSSERSLNSESCAFFLGCASRVACWLGEGWYRVGPPSPFRVHKGDFSTREADPGKPQLSAPPPGSCLGSCTTQPCHQGASTRRSAPDHASGGATAGRGGTAAIGPTRDHAKRVLAVCNGLDHFSSIGGHACSNAIPAKNSLIPTHPLLPRRKTASAEKPE